MMDMQRLLILILGLASTLMSVSAAPLTDAASTVDIPQESILGVFEISDYDDIALLPVSNGTHSAVLILNATLIDAAGTSNSDEVEKRSASPWHWLRLKGPMYKRDASPQAEPWHWLRLKGPMYKRDANADADPWHWLRLKGPMY